MRVKVHALCAGTREAACSELRAIAEPPQKCCLKQLRKCYCKLRARVSVAGMAFVRVSEDGTQLRLGDHPFYFCGANCYYLMARAAAETAVES